jgi:hypothetical protein
MTNSGRITLRGGALGGLLAGALFGCGPGETFDPGAAASEPEVGAESAALT